jgi:DNA-directed RNA polymerase subunit beta
MNNLFINNIGDLSEAQKASYLRFLCKGITEELLSFPNPFFTKIKVPTRIKKKVQTCQVFLYIHKIKLKGPLFDLNLVLKRDLTYAIQLYIPSEYTYLFNANLDIKNIYNYNKDLTNGNLLEKKITIKKIRVKQDIFFGEIPLMTEEGTFIINGCERVIINQIIRSPGIYFRKEFLTPKKLAYTATIISDKGLWTKFILDEQFNQKTQTLEKDRIYIQLNNFKENIGDPKERKEESDENKIFIYDLINYFSLTNKEIYDSLKYPSLFLNQQLTREKNKNGEPMSVREKEKSNEDVVYLIKNLFTNSYNNYFSIGKLGRYNINKKLNINLPSNINSLTATDFFGIIDGLIELKYYDRTNDDIDHIKNKQIRSVGELLQIQLRAGFYRLQKAILENSSLSKLATSNTEIEEYLNSEDWIVDPRPVTNTIKEFFKTSQLSQFSDQINPLAELTHKRRISVFGPNGLKRDHISTIIRDIHPSQYGRLCPIETPEGQNAGLITSISMFGRISSLGWIEAPYFLIKNSKIRTDKATIFLNPEQESLLSVAFADTSLDINRKIKFEYISTKENYSFYIKNNRNINFITTSPLQVISLAAALIPFIEHDDANRALMGSNMQRQAVPLIFTQKPIVGTGLEPVAILDSNLIVKSYSEGHVIKSSCNFIQIKDTTGQKIKYILCKYQRSNQETSINQKPLVWDGEKIFSGQIIADGPSTCDGELSLGRNLTLAYMPWEGYNYEDAIVINERLVYDDCLTSLHIEAHEINLSSSLLGSDKLTNKLPYLTSYTTRHLDDEGIVKIGSYVKENDILVGKLTPCEEDTSPEAKLLRALYGHKKQNYRDTSLRVSSGTEGRVIDIRIISSRLENKDKNVMPALCEVIRIYIAHVRKIKVGDKLSGRHGNKGIISRILPRQDMPVLPDGTPIDIIFNPLGVPSRMNVGQIFECLLGFAGQKLGQRFKITPFDEIYGAEASRILVNQKLKEASFIQKQDWIFNPYSPGKILLKDGRTGEFFDNPITVGKSYILKLVHLVEDKIHARATGPYSMITEQPLAGKSQKGGQRFGEMEVWALEAYGCANTLQELLTIKSDDIDGHNDIYESLTAQKQIAKPTPSIPEAFLALIRELHALGLDFSIVRATNNFYSTVFANDISINIFKDLETRLKLRTLLAHKKSEIVASNTSNTEKI